MSKTWEIIVFTAGMKEYADRILNELDPYKYITQRLYRDSCIYIEGYYVKNLIIFCEDMSKIVIVDNTPNNYALQPANGIEIKSWYADNMQDKQLSKLSKVLNLLATMEDVRVGLKNINNTIVEPEHP